MMPVEYDVSEVILHSSIGEIQLDDYVENGEWSITVSECKEYEPVHEISNNVAIRHV